MREIEFRGKNIVTNEWVYGDLIHNDDKTYIKTETSEIEVDSKTIGQYLELKDCEGNKIYEDDILKDSDNNTGEVSSGIIKTPSSIAYCIAISPETDKHDDMKYKKLGWLEHCKIIGNEYD